MQADSDANGYISAEELNAIMGINSKRKAMNYISNYDHDRDGVMSAAGNSF